MKKIEVHSNLTGIAGTLREDIQMFMIISCRILLRMRNVSDRSYRENRNTLFFIFKLIRPCCVLDNSNPSRFSSTQQFVSSLP